MQSGTWTKDGKTGTFNSKIEVKGDKFCFIIGDKKEYCVSVYTDASTIYETDGKKVEATHTKPAM